MNCLNRWGSRTRGLTGLILCLLAGAALLGCGVSGQESVQDWIAQQRAQRRPDLAPITEPKIFAAQPYQVDSLLDPFNSQRRFAATRWNLRVPALSLPSGRAPSSPWKHLPSTPW